MRALPRKLLRDLAQTKGQALSIALVVASGVAVLLASLSTHEALLRAQQDFYTKARFGQVFADLKSAPATLAEQIEALPGVAQADTRLSGSMLLDMPGMVEPATGQLLSLDGTGQPRLNRLKLRSGRFPDPGRDAEALVNETFAEAHGLKPGDSVTTLLNGRRRTLRLVGTVLSPEFIYAIRAQDPIPDNRRFGVFWMSRPAAAASLDLAGSFNSVVLTLAPGAKEGPVIQSLDHLLEPFGGQGAYGRDQQRSHRFVTDELAQQRMMAYSIPTIFLGVAAFLLHMVVGRLVSAQREIIATLKALGFGDAPIARHFMGYVGVVVVAGIIGGAFFGHWQGAQMSRLYQEYFRFPRLDYHLDPALVAGAGLLCLGVAALGVSGSLREVAALQPAEAMRPAAPARTLPRAWDRGPWMQAFTPAGRLAVRGLMRRPWQTLLTSLGIAMAMAVVILGLFWWDGVDLLLQQQFHLAERGDAHLFLKRPAGDGALPELTRLPGVLAVEGQRLVAVRLRAGHRERLTALVGLSPGSRLRRLLDTAGRSLPLPAEGLVLSQSLAERLDLRPGSRVWVEVLEQGRPAKELTVARVVADWVGGAAYAPRETVNRLMGEGPQFNAAALQLESSSPPGLQEAVNRIPMASGLSLKGALVRGFQRTTAEHIWVFVAFLVGFATVIAVGVVYNSIRIAL
ncbi:MAG TPA: ABC transporter permease, partial [Holophagaceae bacterium]|nr:ABC transporter permease [Holophagaceae bacterium]